MVPWTSGDDFSAKDLERLRTLTAAASSAARYVTLEELRDGVAGGGADFRDVWGYPLENGPFVYWWFGTFFIFTIYWEYIIIPTDELIFFRGIETINQYIVDLMGLNEVLHGHQTWLEIHGNPRTKWDDMTHPTVR